MNYFSVVMQMERITAHKSDFSLFWGGEVKSGWQSISDTFSRKGSALNLGGPDGGTLQGETGPVFFLESIEAYSCFYHF